MNNDTIAALSTPEGPGALAIIRVSGENSIPILTKIFHPVKSTGDPVFKSWRAYYGIIRDDVTQTPGEEVVVTVFKAPNSYTTEDMVEISCHGGAIAPGKILTTLFKHGVRPAKRGEFTKRALLNGRIDLLHAEAIDAVINADTLEDYDRALQTMTRVHRTAVGKIKDSVHNLLEEIEVSIEDPDDHQVDENILKHSLVKIIQSLKIIVEDSTHHVDRKEYTVVIFGPKNAGKSTLFNNLLGMDKAIIADVPGTTRDTVEAVKTRNARKVKLVDTAGYGESHDIIDGLALEKTIQTIKHADFILFMVDGTKKWTKEDEQWCQELNEKKNISIVLNKADLNGFLQNHPQDTRDFLQNTLKISARNQKDVKQIWKVIEEQLGINYIPQTVGQTEILLLNQRQLNLITDTRNRLQTIHTMIEQGYYTELVAFELHRVRKNIDEWLGTNTAPDLLDEIFQHFCMGK